MSNRRTFEQLTERERLELAAKAAGLGPLDFDYAEREGHGLYIGPRLPMPTGVVMAAMHRYWRPLADDGDALRLAVAIPSLNLQWVIAEAYQAADTEAMRLDYVRRAIFRVAVEFGSRMP